MIELSSSGAFDGGEFRGAPEWSHSWPYNYEGFSEHLRCGRKITGMVMEHEGTCSLKFCFEKGTNRVKNTERPG